MNLLTIAINKIIAISANKGWIKTKDLSDRYHTIGDYRYLRTKYFSYILNQNPDISWKSKQHYDEANDPMFNDCFIAGIDTPTGQATHHLKLEFWDEFKVRELEKAPPYDGHTPEEALARLDSIFNKQSRRTLKKDD